MARVLRSKGRMLILEVEPTDIINRFLMALEKRLYGHLWLIGREKLRAKLAPLGFDITTNPIGRSYMLLAEWR